MEKKIQNKQPEFFSYGYSLVMRTFNWLLTFYITFSFVIYLFYYFLNENIVQKKWFNEQFILQNSYYAGILSLNILLSVYSLYRKSVPVYLVYFSYTLFLNAVLLFKYPQSNVHQALAWILVTITAINVVYLVYFYFKSIGYFKDKLIGVNQDAIVHEIRLRSDMMKINFNGFLIRSKIHKLFPNMLFRKEDYYFMNRESYANEDMLQCGREANASGYNSKSTIDNTEYESLE
jgi:hypothetical protein